MKGSILMVKRTRITAALALAVALGASGGASVAANPSAGAATEKEALVALMDLGGVLMRSEPRPSGRAIVAVNFNGHPQFQDDWLKLLAALPHLKTLKLAGTSLTDAGLTHVKKCTQLETLSLAETKITAAGLAELKGLKSLRRLDLSGTAVTSAAIGELRAALPDLEVTGGNAPEGATSSSPPGDQPIVLSAAKIKQLRRQADEATQVPENTPPGWSKSRVDPDLLIGIFAPLRLRQGFVLRAYQFKEEGNGNGMVWALPKDAEFPEPKDCPVLESHMLKAPKPSEALDDVMEAIEGDDSAGAHLAASLLRRQFSEFGALWHGCRWTTHTVLDGDPWKAGPLREDESPLDRPESKPQEWQWQEEQPKSWGPLVRVEKDRVTVMFYTYCAVGKEGIYRHTDVYRRGKYRARVEEKKIAEGPRETAL